jgi:transcription elongation factor GreA
MRVPIRKAGKYTFFKADPNLTPEKFSELKNNLEKLIKRVRPRLAEEVKRLAAFGDFSENAEYQIAKGKLRGINERILQIEDLVKRAVIIAPTRGDGIVRLGSQVTVKVNGKEKTYLLLGSEETSPGEGVISNNSPLGAALMGRWVGERIKLKLADKEVEYEIIDIK